MKLLLFFASSRLSPRRIFFPSMDIPFLLQLCVFSHDPFGGAKVPHRVLNSASNFVQGTPVSYSMRYRTQPLPDGTLFQSWSLSVCSFSQVFFPHFPNHSLGFQGYPTLIAFAGVFFFPFDLRDYFPRYRGCLLSID